MADGPKKFSRYFLLDLLAQGGMAEIYRARMASQDGAGRIIVIKRIQSGYGSNQEFLQMFRSEIKVTMGFNHPNIVQLYDFGEEQSQPYIAMEWVDGRNLRQFMTRFLEMKQKFPIDLAVQIIEQAACGLHYAHHFKDKISGQSLNIVHRDISPQNIIISFEGTVKVIDFGIAKANNNSESTRAGVIKGKPSYLSPEQINGDVLDGRSDIFSLGTVLWELLAGKKLFAGDNDLAVLKMIESCNTYVKPPSTLNPDVPPELDYVVLKALAKQREKRYQTAEEFQRALHKFLYSHSPDFNPSDLSYYAKDLFKNEIVEDRKKIQRLNDEVERLLTTKAAVIAGVGASDKQGIPDLNKQDIEETMVTRSKPTFTVIEQGNDAKVEVDKRGSALPPPRYRSPSHSGNVPLSQPQQRRRPEQSRSGSAYETKRPQSGGEGVIGPAVKIFIAVASVAGVVLYFGKDFGLFGRDQQVVQPPTEQVTQQQVVAKTINLRLNLIPGGGNPVIKVNDKVVSLDNPVTLVPLDAPLDVVVERDKFEPFHRQFSISSGKVSTGLNEWKEDIQLQPKQYGILNIKTNVSADVMITIEGKPWVIQTPLEEVKLPVGTYLIQMTNKALGMGLTKRVTIEEGKAVNLEENLQLTDQPQSDGQRKPAEDKKP